ncbi:MAG: ATP-binding protein, partial [Pseudomonadota bacterium]
MTPLWLRVAGAGFLLVGLLVALHLMSNAVQNSQELAQIFVPLLMFSLGGLVLLLVLMAVSLARVVGAYRRREPGARLTARMVVLFVVLSLLPVAVVYGYSMQFLMRGIDSWFDVEIDKAMHSALELGQASLDQHKRYLLHATENLVPRLRDATQDSLAIDLGAWRSALDATEVTVLDKSGRVLALNNASPGLLAANVPRTAVLQQVREGRNFAGLTAIGDEDLLHVRVVVADIGVSPFILQALYPLSEHVNKLSEAVQDAFNRYQELAFLRQSLKFSFTLTLSLVLLFSFFSAVWAATFSARRLLAPVSKLAEATRAIADGDYGTQLPVPGRRDELGFLVKSFNAMTRRIAQARDLAAASQRQVEAQRANLQTLLSHISTGVIACDAQGQLRTANAAATRILDLDLEAFEGRSFKTLGETSPELSALVETVTEEWAYPARDWQSQVTLNTADGQRILRCSGTPLPVASGTLGGRLLMLEDVTSLIQAQRDAAWAEVARRLAHEIKNPLTPIQLSAERIRRRYLDRFSGDDGRVLDRATHTIVQQVDAMKTMVNAFSDYARPSQLEGRELVFDALVNDVLELYRVFPRPRLHVKLGARGAQVRADSVKLRQVIHNLVKNAQEAVVEADEPGVWVETRRVGKGEYHTLELDVEDNGPGFDPEMLGKIFDPYVTTKDKGTGLGLAIVRKIVSEHGGSVVVAQ